MNLSGGNKRKVCALLALLTGNRIVLLDEPSTGMDPSMRRTLWKVIEEQRKARQCILFTTHTMEEAEAVCSRLGIMVKGKLEALGSNQHLKNKFGGGYILNLTLDDEMRFDAVDSFLSKHFTHWYVWTRSAFRSVFFLTHRFVQQTSRGVWQVPII
jgi:ABC-type multidrug transport system ATPase subunit